MPSRIQDGIKAQITDRGTLGGGPKHTKQELQRGAGNLFGTALDDWLAEDPAKGLAMTDQKWYKGTTEDLKNEIHEQYDELRQWHKEFSEKKHADAVKLTRECRKFWLLRLDASPLSLEFMSCK